MGSADLIKSLRGRPAFAAPRQLLRLGIYVFAPDVLGRQLVALAVCICLRRLFWRFRRLSRKVCRKLLCVVSERFRRIEKLRTRRGTCTDYDGFRKIGEQLDTLQGLDKWKEEDTCPYYDADLLKQRTAKYGHLKAIGDVEGCMFALRGELLRKHFGTTNPALFEVTNTGTKRIVEGYVQAICDSMSWVAFSHRESVFGGADTSNLTIADKLTFFSEIAQSFGRTALVLSGGASLGIYHFGVVKALHLNGLLPRILSGTSAGSIACGAVGVRTDEELQEMWQTDFAWESRFNLNFFSGPDFLRFVRRKGSELYSTENLGKALRDDIGEWTFLEAFDRTGRICNITVSGMPGNTRYPMLLNYLTSPHVLVWSASLASCALPGVFEPQELLEKDRHGNIVPYVTPGLKWQDGSMQSDLPLTRLSELFNANFFIVSQVNPQARIITGGGIGSARGPVFRTAQFLRRQVKQYLLSIAELGLGTAGRRVHPWLRPVGYTPIGLIVQEYEGDVTIYNGGGLLDLPKVLDNPSGQTVRRYTAASENATWWHIPQIQNACASELVMDEITRELRAELAGTSNLQKSSSSCSLLDRMAQAPSVVKKMVRTHSMRSGTGDINASAFERALGVRRATFSSTVDKPLQSGRFASGRLMASNQSVLSLLATCGGEDSDGEATFAG